VLNNNLPYASGPAWLAEYALQDRHVLAVAGTHGKTTTSSMLAWVLECAGKQPSYLIGGVPENFGVSARLQNSDYFVIEADEYDSAFFDKRSKFIHYHPRTLILNNLEFDHADIFKDLAAIQTQFHHLVRIVPEKGVIIWPQADKNLQAVLTEGCWTPQEFIGVNGWHAKAIVADNSQFSVYYHDEWQADVNWSLVGEHNQLNALTVFAAAKHIGIEPTNVATALTNFKNVKRRLQVIANKNDITVYDDFAHHPTAIKLTLSGLRKKVGQQPIVALIELGSYTMRHGDHQDTLLSAIADADYVIFYQEENAWQPKGKSETPWKICHKVDEILPFLQKQLAANTHIVLMSNRSFGGLHKKVVELLEMRADSLA
jgi:UDP-N-acetylmuramate: L-alanyl-gamma-D-glutamyl-meso-diaminopimelate ligase